ncbi:MAG: hypothetical protein LBQ61_02210 [Spirochaetales bacterium]|nr:hypothetical protein [Spirochaetales bacterium]
MADKTFKEFGYISDYSQWDDIINEKAMYFFELHQVYPNILLASNDTFGRIDNYLRQHPVDLIYPEGGEPPPFDGLSSFNAVDYRLEFCLDPGQEENYFVLVYDEAPEFDGEELSDEGEEEPQCGYKMT